MPWFCASTRFLSGCRLRVLWPPLHNSLLCLALISFSLLQFEFLLCPCFQPPSLSLCSSYLPPSPLFTLLKPFSAWALTHTVLSLLAKWLLTHFLRGRLWDCLDLTDTQENNHWLELSESKWCSSFKQGSTNICNVEGKTQLFNWKWNISYQWKAALHWRSLESWKYAILESCGPASSTQGHW